LNDQYCILEKMQYGYIVTTSGKYHQTVCVLLNSVISNDLQVNIISVVHTFLGSLSLKNVACILNNDKITKKCMIAWLWHGTDYKYEGYYGYYHVTLVVLATIDNGPYFV